MSALTNIAKLGATGATITAIAFGFLALSPSEEGKLETQDAQADITDFTLTTVDSTRRFASTIEAMGMKPRPFDVNGNTMYFASGSYKMKPMEVLQKSQEIFVEAGVNEKNHSKVMPIRQKARNVNWGAIKDDVDKQMLAFDTFQPTAEAMTSGDVVPTEISSDYVEMVGLDLDIKSNAEVWESLKRSDGNLMSTIKGYRYMDAHWEEGGQRSAVTAVWSDKEDFDANRFAGKGKQSPADPNVPACIGCERNFRVQSLDKNEPYQSNTFIAQNQNIEATYNFYRTAMLQRGWSEGGAQPYLNRLGEHLDPVAELNQRGRLLSLEKGGESMQLAIFDNGTGVEVMTLHETEGAQNALPKMK